MTFRKPVATIWKVNESQFRQMFLNPWYVLSCIWVHFGLWRPIFTVRTRFSHIFPASAWSPFLSVNLTDKLARLTLTSHHHVKSKFCLYTSNHSITTNDFEDICQLLELTVYDQLHANHVCFSLILSCLTKYIRWQLVIVSSNSSSRPMEMWYLIAFLLPFDIPNIYQIY